AAKSLIEWLARFSGSNDLACVDVDKSELADAPRRDIRDLSHESIYELLLDSEIPGFDIPAVVLLRHGAPGIFGRNIGAPATGLRDRDWRNAVLDSPCRAE